MIKTIINSIYFAYAFISVTFYTCIAYVILKLLTIAPLKKTTKTNITNRIKHFTMNYMVSFLKYWFSGPIYIKYDKKILDSKRNIVISNHCSDYDWIFVSLVSIHLGKYDTFYILMKKSLLDMPMVGYLLKKFRHMFLNRKREKDIYLIHQYMKELEKEKNYNILIFPEGTYTFTEALQSSKEFAEKIELKIDGESYRPNRVLLPHKLGFNLIREDLKNAYQAVVNTTIFTNPYMKMPVEECSFIDLFIKGTKKLNQALILEYVKKDKIDDSFLNLTFYQKDKNLEKYVNQFNGRLQNLEDFKKLCNQVSSIKSSDIIETIYVECSFGWVFRFFPIVLVVLFILFRMQLFSFL